MQEGRHEHCDKCFNVHCQVPVRLSVSCSLIKCPRSCGAILHLCKATEHRLLCPNETAPCLNADYGCPLTMQRQKLAEHLEVCPASVVCCSRDWNRWPVSDSDATFYGKVSESLRSSSEVGLDVALALRDQSRLFQSIKMKTVFPELVETLAGEPAAQEASETREQTCPTDVSKSTGCGSAETEEKDEERDALANSADVSGIQNHSSWETVFTKEMGGCNQTVKNLNKEAKGEKMQGISRGENETDGARLADRNTATSWGIQGTTGLAPWQDGVLERLRQEANIAEYNMYLVHNGAMLINFGQLAACTPREKDFVYGSLEPIEVRTERTYNVPTSYRAKRIHLKDPSCKVKTTQCGVDTEDLGYSIDDLPESDLIGSTLLCSLEKELKGHAISESASTDGLYIDVGTQTHIFPSAPFKADATLADVAVEHLGLHMRLEMESVTRRHNRTSSAFSYICGRFFRRDEFSFHSRNNHCDIQAPLHGWFQERCPLGYLGCTFSQIRFHPAGQWAAVKFCTDDGTLVLKPQVLVQESPRVSNGGAPHTLDPLSSLPFEILQHIAAHLDSFTLSQLARVSRLMRDVCASLLQHRGMVCLHWSKKTYSHGGSSWKCREKVWRFSSGFSPVDRWTFSDAPSMSEHLKTCSFYQRAERSEPVAIVGLAEVRDKHTELKLKR